jgi:hypothetical protein
LFLSLSFQVKKKRAGEMGWYHPWDVGLVLLKEMASLAGGILSATTSHPGRLHMVCVFTDHLRAYDPDKGTESDHVSGLYPSRRKARDAACG